MEMLRVYNNKFNRYFCSTEPLKECYVEIGGVEKSCVCAPGGDRIPCAKVKCKQGETYVFAKDTCEILPPKKARDISQNRLLKFYFLNVGIPAACAIERTVTKRTLKVVPIANLQQSLIRNFSNLKTIKLNRMKCLIYHLFNTVTAFVDDHNVSK
ncbi:IS231-related, transposase, partial [Trichinella spiralis]|uniref:IS231-related, transposase n=1 Tax=Trichinella spiralis TaxID=6334 RepID=UPI0001EFDE8C